LLFNGTVGETFVNYSFFVSAFLMISGGIFSTAKSASYTYLTRITLVLALISYLPMVWQRFNFTFGIDRGGLYFDVGILLYIIALIAYSLLPRKAGDTKSPTEEGSWKE